MSLKVESEKTAEKCTKFRNCSILVVICLVIWSSSIAVVSPLIIYTDVINYDEKQQCGLIFPDVDTSQARIYSNMLEAALSFLVNPTKSQ